MAEPGESWPHNLWSFSRDAQNGSGVSGLGAKPENCNTMKIFLRSRDQNSWLQKIPSQGFFIFCTSLPPRTSSSIPKSSTVAWTWSCSIDIDCCQPESQWLRLPDPKNQILHQFQILPEILPFSGQLPKHCKIWKRYLKSMAPVPGDHKTTHFKVLA